MIKSTGVFIILVTVALSAFCQKQQTNPDLESSIRKRNEIWNTSFNNRDTASFFSLFNAESIWITGGGKFIGFDRCRALVRGLFRNRPDVTWINTAEKVEVFGFWKMAYETGTWTETWTEKNDTSKSEIIGKYWIMYTYENDKWTIHSSIFTALSCVGSYCKQQ